jgi:hypothetical protein
LIFLTLIAWLSMPGFEFILHAGLLAGPYRQPSPLLVPPLTAFKLIPLGYLSFLPLTVLLVWLMTRLKLSGGRQGAFFGLTVGGLTWGAFVLGLFSRLSVSHYSLVGLSGKQ